MKSNGPTSWLSSSSSSSSLSPFSVAVFPHSTLPRTRPALASLVPALWLRGVRAQTTAAGRPGRIGPGARISGHGSGQTVRTSGAITTGATEPLRRQPSRRLPGRPAPLSRPLLLLRLPLPVQLALGTMLPTPTTLIRLPPHLGRSSSYRSQAKPAALLSLPACRREANQAALLSLPSSGLGHSS